MGNLDEKKQARLKRKTRIRKRVKGTPERPRLTVFRSAKHIYAQVIDDVAGNTIAAASSLEKAVKEHPDLLKRSHTPKETEKETPKEAKKETKKKPEPQVTAKVAVSNVLGTLIARRLMEKGIKKVVFDRNGFLYHGRIKAVAESARKAGLDF